MKTGGGAKKGIDMAAKARLIDLLRYVEELVGLTETTVFSVGSYRTLRFLEHELQNRVGIQHDAVDPEGAVWIRIERLQRRDPPKPATSIAPWLVIGRDPSRVPEIVETRLETMPRALAARLVEEGRVDPKDVMSSPRGEDVNDVRWRLDWLPDVKEAIDEYVSGPWQSWSEEEKPRRETIAIYDRFFSVVQLIESSGVENPTEVVFGVGMILWNTDGKTIEHPLIEVLVEVDIDPVTHAVRVRPRESDPQLYVKPLTEAGVPSVANLNEAARKHFAHIGNGGDGGIEFSPFLRRSFEPVLQQAAAILSATGAYFPNIARDPADRSLPPIDENLVVTDTWAIYARPRSANVFVQDVQRLKEAVEKADALPPCAEQIVSEPTDEEVYSGIDLRGGIGASGKGNSDAPIAMEDTTPDVFFPKPYNKAQIEIVRRLEKEDGVVVQGPPGTGKTHTIANIICHYLATGRSVLVVSKGEPALQVLRDHIPEGIRDLTISLLTSEREGLKQLETAVTCMANEVANKDVGRLERDRRDAESEIIQLRKRIGEIDERVGRSAKLQLAPVAGLNIRPAELAQHIVANADKHKWLPDLLGPDDKFNAQFSDEDIKAVRLARKVLDADLAFLGCRLPSPNDLPDTMSVCAIHNDLVRAANLTETAEKRCLPRMSTRSQDAVTRAEQLLADVRDIRTVLELMSRTELGWLRAAYDVWLAEGTDSAKSRPLKLLIDEMHALLESRQEFLARRVGLPPLHEFRDDVIEAVRRCMRGARPFALFSFGRRAAKGAFAKITVAGELPKTQSDWKHVASFFGFQQKVANFVTRWNERAMELRTPRAPDGFDEALRWLAELRSQVDSVQAAAIRYREHSSAELKALFAHSLDENATPRDVDAATRAIETLETNIGAEKLSTARIGLQAAVERLQSSDGQIVKEMADFIRESVGKPAHSENGIADRWQDLVRELRRVLALRPELETVARVANLIHASGAPEWAAKLRLEPVIVRIDPWTPDIWQETWRFRRFEAYLKQINRRGELHRLAEERAKCERSLAKKMAELVRLRTYLGLIRRMTQARLAALHQFVAAIRRIGKGTGISAPYHRGDAREAMSKCIETVPCWIMPTWRVSESLPASLGSFDLVITDEASQSDAMALPALIRGKKLLVVGDNRQVSPSPIGIPLRNILQLRQSYLRDQPFAALLLPGSSLYDLALSVFPGERVLLNEHFRCVEPIIRFSFQFYPERIQPIRIPTPSERLDPPLVDVYLPHGERDGQKINRAEALAIVDEIERLVNDLAYEKRTIGVVSLIGAKQAQFIQNLLIERIGEDAFLKHKIACGDSATFQGKERDIMFVSMVASPGKATAQTALLWEQRFNVALSRARDRMYLVRSVKPEDLRNPRDLKLRAINHFFNPMPVPAREAEELINLCESDFERDVFRRLSKLGYRVTPQVSVGEFHIDLVVDGDDDRRLAIELDGDRHHGPDRWFEDWNRQKILERVGWVFWRCWASSFALDPDGCMDDLVATLMQMKIQPIGTESARHPYTEHRVLDIDDFAMGERATSGEDEEEPVVEIGDKVIVSFEDDPSRHFVLTLTDDATDLLNGIVSVSEQPGQQLIGVAAEDEVSLEWNGTERRATVLEIEKARRRQRATRPGSAGSAMSPKADSLEVKDSAKQAESRFAVAAPIAETTPTTRQSPSAQPTRPAPLTATCAGIDDEPTEAELAKYREYAESMRQHKLTSRPISEWLGKYRQRRKSG